MILKWAPETFSSSFALPTSLFLSVKLVSIIGLFRFGGHRSATDHVQTQWLAPSAIHFLQIQDQHEGRVGRQMKVVGRNGGLENGYCNNNNNNHNNNNNNNNNSNNNTRNGGYAKKDCSNDTTTVATVPFCLPKKLQVTEKDGSFIALDNNSLKLMRQLERLGHCTEVEVEIVPLSKVPPNVVQEMATMGGGRQSQQHPQSRRNVDEEEEQGNVGQCSEKSTTKKHCRVRCRAAAQAQRRLSVKPTGGGGGGGKGAPAEHRYLCSQHSHCCTESKEHRQEVEIVKSSLDIHQSSTVEPVASTGEHASISHHSPSPTNTITISSTTGTNTATTSSTTTSFSLNGFNTYLSDQQLRSARMSNTMTVMAPCLRQPITTSTPTSDLAMRQFKWHFCCAERQHHGSSSGKSGTTCCSASTPNKSANNSGDHHQCQSGRQAQKKTVVECFNLKWFSYANVLNMKLAFNLRQSKRNQISFFFLNWKHIFYSKTKRNNLKFNNLLRKKKFAQNTI